MAAEGATLVVDLLEDPGSMAAFVGDARTPLPSPRGTGAVAALVTHLHSDHADPPAIARAIAPGAPVLRPARATGGGLETAGMQVAETQLEELGLADARDGPVGDARRSGRSRSPRCRRWTASAIRRCPG